MNLCLPRQLIPRLVPRFLLFTAFTGQKECVYTLAATSLETLAESTSLILRILAYGGSLKNFVLSFNLWVAQATHTFY